MLKYLIPLVLLSNVALAKEQYTKRDKETGSFTSAVTNLYVSCEYSKDGSFIEGRLITIRDNQIFTIMTLDENACSIFKNSEK